MITISMAIIRITIVCTIAIIIIINMIITTGRDGVARPSSAETFPASSGRWASRASLRFVENITMICIITIIVITIICSIKLVIIDICISSS